MRIRALSDNFSSSSIWQTDKSTTTQIAQAWLSLFSFLYLSKIRGPHCVLGAPPSLTYCEGLCLQGSWRTGHIYPNLTFLGTLLCLVSYMGPYSWASAPSLVCCQSLALMVGCIPKWKYQSWESRGPDSQEAFNTYLLTESLRIVVDFLMNVPCGKSGTSAIPKWKP